MFCVMSREVYERYESLSGAEMARLRYPCTTEEAVLELRARGVDARVSTLNSLAARGRVHRPSGEGSGRGLAWSAADVDAAADDLANLGRLTDGAIARNFEGVSADQEREALEAAKEKWPGRHEHNFARVTLADPDGMAERGGAPNRVIYLPVEMVVDLG